jgi:DNA polymerase-3 subunit beta
MSLKLDCPQRDLSDALSLTRAATRENAPQVILQSLKIDARDGGVRVLGCDGEMWIQRDLACMVHEPGSACVQAKLLSDLIGSMHDGDVQLSLVDQIDMLLQQGASEYRVHTRDAEDFPEPPEFGGEGELTLKMGAFREAIGSVIFAVSNDPHRPILTGVQIIYDGNTLTLVATDTHRLAVRKVSQEGIGSSVSAVVPEKALNAIQRLPLGDDDSIVIKFGGGRLGVEAGGAKVVSQLLTGAYPNWERVVPSEFTRLWTVEGDQLAERVKRAMIVARDSANRVKFKGEGDSILISARSEEKGEAKEELPMIAQHGDIEIAFNGQYVLDAIRPIASPGVRVEMTENSRPAVFRSAEDGNDYFCVIMPMALA